MTWTYNVALLATSSLFQTRFYCGDTDSTRPLVQDEEINFVLLSQPDPVNAAAVICDSLAAKYSQDVDATVGSVSESSSKRAEAFRAMAADLRRQSSSLALPIFGGISQSKKDTADQDADAVQPSFRIGQDDYPGTALESDYWRLRR